MSMMSATVDEVRRRMRNLEEELDATAVYAGRSVLHNSTR